jgi:hypothetical protein
MIDVVVLLSVILLVLGFLLLWIFWPKPKMTQAPSTNDIRGITLSKLMVEDSMIASFGTNLREGTSQPSFKSSTRSDTLNPLSTDPLSRYSSKMQDSDLDVDFEIYSTIPNLDESWPN